VSLNRITQPFHQYPYKNKSFRTTIMRAKSAYFKKKTSDCIAKKHVQMQLEEKL